MLRRPLPIRARLVVWYVGVFSLIFGGVSWFLVTNMRTTLNETAQEALELTYRIVSSRLEENPSGLATILQEAVVPGEADESEVIGQILGAGGEVIETSGHPAVAPAAVDRSVLDTVRREGHWHGPVRLPGRPHRDVIVVSELSKGPRAGTFLVLAQTLGPSEHGTQRLLLLLRLAAPIALVVAGAGGWMVAGIALRPVDAMTRRAAGIDARHTADKLPVPRAGDELARLATTLNDMLERLRRALDAERRFSADASHELRTPIGLMEAELDVALRSPRTPPEAREVLVSVREEAARLARIVSNLLLLSRAEATGAVALDRRDADLLDVAMAVAGRFRSLAADRGVELRVDGGPAPAEVDADLLGQAVANLVENALTHTPRSGSVTVSVHDASVEVTDTGVGIAPEQIGHVFDRFYRVDPARGRGGAGLGLEISRRIVEAHGGRIEVASRPGAGSTFAIRLQPQPAWPQSPDTAGATAARQVGGLRPRPAPAPAPAGRRRR